jgi:hypothetical protein
MHATMDRRGRAGALGSGAVIAQQTPAKPMSPEWFGTGSGAGHVDQAAAAGVHPGPGDALPKPAEYGNEARLRTPAGSRLS